MRLRDILSKFLGRPTDASATFSSQQDVMDDDDNVDPFDPFLQPIAIEITDVFDLHTIAPRDVKLVVEEYLLEARRKGFRSIRIIHGKGIGVQREVVQSILGRTTFVTRFADAPPQAGGRGATIAHLLIEKE